LRDLLRFYHSREGAIYDAVSQLADCDRQVQALERQRDTLIDNQRNMQHVLTNQSIAITHVM
jgi:hypothetical protein